MPLPELREPRATALALRAAFRDAPQVTEASARIVDAVEREGTRAMLRFTAQFDQVKLAESELRVASSVLAHARARAAPELLAAIRDAYARAEPFARSQRAALADIESGRDGLRWIPRERVGLYLRRGPRFDARALAARVALARVAGARKLIAASPPSLRPTLPGAYGVDPAILATCAELELELFLAGGAQGVAQLAAWVGETGAVVGQGGGHVRAAMRLLGSRAAVELPASSPSLLLADGTVEPRVLFRAARAADVALALDDAAADVLARAAQEGELRAFGARRDAAVVFAQALAPSRAILLVAQPEPWRGELTDAGALCTDAAAPSAPPLALFLRAQVALG